MNPANDTISCQVSFQQHIHNVPSRLILGPLASSPFLSAKVVWGVSRAFQLTGVVVRSFLQGKARNVRQQGRLRSSHQVTPCYCRCSSGPQPIGRPVPTKSKSEGNYVGKKARLKYGGRRKQINRYQRCCTWYYSNLTILPILTAASRGLCQSHLPPSPMKRLHPPSYVEGIDTRNEPPRIDAELNDT